MFAGRCAVVCVRSAATVVTTRSWWRRKSDGWSWNGNGRSTTCTWKRSRDTRSNHTTCGPATRTTYSNRSPTGQRRRRPPPPPRQLRTRRQRRPRWRPRRRPTAPVSCRCCWSGSRSCPRTSAAARPYYTGWTVAAAARTWTACSSASCCSAQSGTVTRGR